MQRPVHRLARSAPVALLAALLLVCAGGTAGATASPLGSRVTGHAASSAPGASTVPSSGRPAASLHRSLHPSLHQDGVPASRAGFAQQPRLHQPPRLHDAGAAEPVTAVRVRRPQPINTAGARAGAGPPAPYTSSTGSRAPPA